MEQLRAKKGFICDMDGVIYHGNRLLPGVKEFVSWLQRENKQYLLSLIHIFPEKIDSAQSQEEFLELLGQADGFKRKLATMYNICYIRHTINTQDEFYSRENDYYCLLYTSNLFAHARMTRKAVKILVLLVNHLTCLSFLTSYPSFLL